MKKAIVFLFALSGICRAQTPMLSQEATISVLTLGPHQGQVYTAFGHSAFRVHDPVNGIDDAYNYGVFDYNRPDFYLNFARGHNVYRLGVFDYPDFAYVYRYYNRYIHEQKLNLTAGQRQKLFEFLEWNARPENQEYLYDYFFDNCATKIPEVMRKVFGDTVHFDGSYVTTDYSFRELTDLYLEDQPWGDLGIDIGLGLPVDREATPYEYMFLPDYVESGFAHASIMQNGIREPLVTETVIVYESREEESQKTPFTPLAVFSTLFAILTVLSFRDIRRRKASSWADIGLFSVLGVLGVALLLLWLATDHHSTAKNFNLIWALPTHVIAALALIKKPGWLTWYFLVTAIISIGLLVTWSILPQKLHFAFIPLVMAIGLRAYTQYRIMREPAP